jgi:predicted flap endonuclease-1-like 5' DNA nuclease
MMRWLFRLLIFGAVAAAIAFAVSRFLNREEDFDDFDDMEEGFEFQETPVEIEVPATRAGADTMGGAATATMETAAPAATTRPPQTGNLPEERAVPPLIEVNGIGPSYEQRLKAMGINTMYDLANADAHQLSEKLDVIGGVNTVEDWIAQAKKFTGGES